jgi:hypothetical protein
LVLATLTLGVLVTLTLGVLATSTAGVLTTVTGVGGGPAASAVHESPTQTSNDRVTVNIMLRFFMVLLSGLFLALPGFSTLGSHCRPFTGGLGLFVAYRPASGFLTSLVTSVSPDVEKVLWSKVAWRQADANAAFISFSRISSTKFQRKFAVSPHLKSGFAEG